MGYADDWFLHPLISEWERKMVAEGMGVDKEEAKRLAENEKLPIEEVVEGCSEGREKKKIANRFDFEDKKVLEVGCGRGYYTQFLAKESDMVCALDKMVGGREKHMWGEFRGVMRGQGVWNKVVPVQADARDIPMPKDTFDITTCASFFRDVYPNDIQKEIIEEVNRVSEKLRLAVYVDKDPEIAQKNFGDQIELRGEAQKASGSPEKHISHTPFEPFEVKSWFDGSIDIEYFDPDLRGQWALGIDHFVDNLKDTDPKKKELEKKQELLNDKIEEHGCKRPTIMLVRA
ncbi:MAG: class I SAM-dependent methyltransferase [Candidatus Thermoplasmatota archaeon]